jgi:hypothetical protein
MTQQYRVVWKRSLIELKLAELILRCMDSGVDLAPIERAMIETDRRLAVDPAEQGESRSDFERVLIVPPLTITFEVHHDIELVYILDAHYSKPPIRGA